MDVKELVAPDKLWVVAQAKAEELHNAITALAKRSKNAIEGRLRLARRKNAVHYFHVTDSSPTQGFYIPQADAKTVKKLVQKDYDEAALTELNRQLKVVDCFIKLYRPEQLGAIYDKLAIERQAFAEPVHLPDDEFAARWLAVKYCGKEVAADAPLLETSRGERVRSKSEVIIANTLDRLKIPYRYEFPHQLKVRRNSRGRGDAAAKDRTSDALHNPLGNKQDGGRRTDDALRNLQNCQPDNFRKHDSSRRIITFHPDFTCLNVRTRREFIWEHFGRMDDPEYITETLGKFETYTANGIFPGETLIFTMETQERPLNSATVEALARKYLL